MDLQSAFVFSQGLAFLAFLCGVFSFRLKERRYVLMCWVVSAFLSGLHFLLLDRTNAAALALLTSTRFFLAIFTTAKLLMYLYMIILVIIFATTYTSPINLIAVTASLIGTFGSFKKNDKDVRRYLMVAAFCWALHNALIKSPVGALMELIFLISNIVNYYKFYGSPFRRSGETNYSTGN